MKLFMMLFCLILLTACGGDKENVSNKDMPITIETKAYTPTAPVVIENNAKLPFDMPIMPGARYVSGSLKFSKPTKKRGGEAIATIAAQGTPLDVVKYYENALTENGFQAKLGQHNSESTAKVSGIRENGEKLLITSMRRGSKAKEGESQTSIIATKPKPL